MKNLKLLSLTLTLSACGAGGPVDPSFTAYVDSFKSDMTAANGTTGGGVVTSGVSFGDVTKACGDQEKDEVGCCSGGNVTIDPKFWGTASEHDRKMLIYHELGHCVLGRAHRAEIKPYKHCETSDDGSTGCVTEDEPISIMHPTLPPDVDPAYESSLIKELFQ